MDERGVAGRHSVQRIPSFPSHSTGNESTASSLDLDPRLAHLSVTSSSRTVDNSEQTSSEPPCVDVSTFQGHTGLLEVRQSHGHVGNQSWGAMLEVNTSLVSEPVEPVDSNIQQNAQNVSAMYSRPGLANHDRRESTFSGDESDGSESSSQSSIRHSHGAELTRSTSIQQRLQEEGYISRFGPKVGSQDPLFDTITNVPQRTATSNNGEQDLQSMLESKSKADGQELQNNTSVVLQNYVKNKSMKSYTRKLGMLTNRPSPFDESWREPDIETGDSSTSSRKLPVGAGRNDDSVNKYYDALQGPELEVLKNSADWELPTGSTTRWPFLLRFPISAFGITLGLGSQTMLWKSICRSEPVLYFYMPEVLHFQLWCLALLALATVSAIYLLKCIFYFEAVRREFAHPVRVNFFFAPWVACMFLTIGIPRSLHHGRDLPPAVWFIFMIPIFCLELKIYGQWLSARSRRQLSKVANPTTHLSIVGNFVLANLATHVGWFQAGFYFWSVGWFFYIILLVTLYQRLPTSQSLPLELHPVYFFFVAAPSAASIAWAELTGKFDNFAKVIFFFALFQYTLLVVRPKIFFGFRFSVTWWAYTFPMTAIALTAVQYSEEEPSWVTKVVAMVLSIISILVVAAIFCTTLMHAFVWKSLFPNDMAIGIHDIKQRKILLPLKAKRKYQTTMRRWSKGFIGSSSSTSSLSSTS